MFEITGNRIALDLTPEEQQMCIESFITTKLRPESASIYQENLNAGNSIKTAIYEAIVNENVNDVIALVNSLDTDPKLSKRFMEMCNTSCSKYVVEE